VGNVSRRHSIDKRMTGTGATRAQPGPEALAGTTSARVSKAGQALSPREDELLRLPFVQRLNPWRAACYRPILHLHGG
jgi:hypothetical protein